MKAELVALLGQREIGRVRADREGRLTFSYDEGWQSLPQAHPVSVSMSLARREHRHEVVSPFLWGLLPDSSLVLERWAKQFRVSAGNALALLAHVGEDCAGAVRFVSPERLAAASSERDARVDWIDDAELGERLRLLRRDASAWRRPGDAGWFTLAGAQPKTALYRQGQRFGVPSGGLPTTHILKLGKSKLDGHVENEHFCLLLAREAGLAAAGSEVLRFEDQVALVVERFDRIRNGVRVLRVQQEDLAQALSVQPANKSEKQGGPGALAIVDVLRQHSRRPDEDVLAFLRALAFKFLMAATDAHGKNTSLLLGAQGWVRLAPLYDVASGLPYFDPWKTKLSMQVGGKYRLRNIGVAQWRRLARELTLEPDQLLSLATGLARALPDHATDALRACRDQGLHHSVLKRLVAGIRERCADWLRLLPSG